MHKCDNVLALDMMNFHIITLFPEGFDSYFGLSILGRAIREKIIKVAYYNPRDFAVAGKSKEKMTYAERRVDDRPYGGGPGMVMEAMPVVRAVEKAVKTISRRKGNRMKIVFFGPSGKQFTNAKAESLKKYSDVIFICGRYEGIDARVKKMFRVEEISIGPYILSGGELPAMVMIEAISRRIKGVIGDYKSIEEKRVAGSNVYTRPEVVEFKGKKYKVPKILLSGHHGRIDTWKSANKGK